MLLESQIATLETVATTEVPGEAVSDIYVPDALIYEMVDGKPIYYSGWQDVLKGEKTIEQTMASSLMQAYLVGEVFAATHVALRKKYIFGTNEAGLKFKKGDWRAADICLWTKASLKNTPLNDHYALIIPEIVIEIDTKADLLTNPNYYFDKTKHLHKNGVRRVLWIFTSSEQVMIAEKGEKWSVQDWSEPVEVVDEFMLNVKELVDAYEDE
jgi:Uma2 family endonuclease